MFTFTPHHESPRLSSLGMKCGSFNQAESHANRSMVWGLPPFKVFLIYFGVFLLSFLGYLNSALGILFFFLLVGVYTYLTTRKLEWGMYLIFAELFVGSFGYLFSFQGISLRIAFFVVFWGIFLFRFLQGRKPFPFPLSPFPFPSFAIFFLWLLFSFIRGVVLNGFSQAFLDFNGYLFLTLFIPFSFLPAMEQWSKRAMKHSFMILKGAVGFLFFLSIGIEFLFSRFGFVGVLYGFIRDLRIGEITMLYQNMVRVFVQSDVYAVVGVILAIAMILFSSSSSSPTLIGDPNKNKKTKRSFGFFFSFPDSCLRRNDGREVWDLRRNEIWARYGFLFLCFTTLLISGSRSFWLGTAVALLGLIFFVIRYCVVFRLPVPLREARPGSCVIFFKRLFAIAATAAFSVLCIMLLTGVGFGGQKDVFHNRLSMGEAAASSRSAQAGPLWHAIVQAPFAGHGFGKTVAYVSKDPRAIAATGGSGEVTTSAFELGWMDVALKTGLVGTLLYVSFIFLLMRSLWSKIRNSTAPDSALARAKGGREFEIRNTSQIQNPKSQTDEELGVGQFENLSRFIVHCSLFFSLLALGVFHFFTPYLNHPLGIGIILLALVALNEKNRYSEESTKVHRT